MSARVIFSLFDLIVNDQNAVVNNYIAHLKIV